MSVLAVLNKKRDKEEFLKELRGFIRVAFVNNNMKGMDIYFSQNDEVFAKAVITNVRKLISAEYVEEANMILPNGHYIFFKSLETITPFKIDDFFKYQFKVLV